ncbi:MAG: COR domain-containing protein [Ferruginibacter sp.]
MEKPRAILTLEKRIVKVLQRVEFTYEPQIRGCFSVDNENEVIGLHLTDCNIKDLTIFSEFSKLKVLDISYNSNNDFNTIPALESLEYLSLSGNKITDIKFLARFKHLRKLNLYNNNIKDFSVLEGFKKLEYLLLENNDQNIDLSFVSKLSTLTEFLLRGKGTNISSLVNCKQLESLYLIACNLTEINFLSDLKNLKFLYLYDNPIKDASSLKVLKKLETLNLSNTNIASLNFITELINLHTLKLNDITNLSFDGLSKLENLENLYLNNTKSLSYNFISSLKRLKTLSVSNNKIDDISFLTDLKNLKDVNLDNNNVKDILPLLDLIKNGVTIDLFGTKNNVIKLSNNSIDKSLQTIIKNGNEAILRHFERIQNEGIDFIYEAKVTFVGEGSAGKTSLQQRLLNLNAGLPTEDNRTRGIKIYDWEFDQNSGNKYIAHTWDFGGQDVYYPVHRFFLTADSVFVLLASSRQSNHNFEYWIPTIFQFGGNSPIIIGQTCHDGNKVMWNDIGYYLSNNNFNIIKTGQLPYHELNLPNNNEGLKAMKDSIINQIFNLPHFGKGVPKSWIPVREAIASEAKSKPCISFDLFAEICRKTNFQKFEELTNVQDLASFLHSLGIILWYSDNKDLKDWVILQPDWAMNAVYEIIDDSEIQNRRGFILSTDFKRIWQGQSYAGKHNILKKMLEVFKIAFPKKHIKEDYIIPARLVSMPPEYEWPETESYLRLEYQYEFMPKGLVNQISAELSRSIKSDNDVWNNAVNLKNDTNTASGQIIENFYNRKISIKTKGKDARSLIIVIMNAMKDITDGYKGVTPTIIVPCNCIECQTNNKPSLFHYDRLISWSEKRDYVVCNESGEEILIEALLFTVGLSNPKKETKEKANKARTKPLKTFISYSKFDGESNKDGVNYLEDFKKHLAPLSTYNNLIQSWDDTLLIPGEDWNDKIENELRTSEIIFLLISKDFLNTKYIRETELKIITERQKNKECVVIPIIIKDCGWSDIEILKNLNALPRKGNVISSWQNNPNWKTIDQAWLHVYEEVKKIISDFKN